MAVSLAWGLAYTALFTAAVPWAVLPFGLYTFGLALASPGMTVMTLNEFPALRGLGSALQGFVQMIVFSLVSGLLGGPLEPATLDRARGMVRADGAVASSLETAAAYAQSAIESLHPLPHATAALRLGEAAQHLLAGVRAAA